MTRLTLVSWNVHKAVGLDGRRDPARILAVLNEIGADVAILQEADRRLGPRRAAIPRFLIAQETDYRPADVARSEVSLGWHGNAILVRAGIEIDGAGRIDLPGLEPRGAIRVRIGGVTLVGTHLGLLRGSRRQQMARICDHLGSRAPTAVVAGDFNEWAAVRGYEPFARAFEVTTPGPSYPAIRPIGALDGFAHGSGVRLTDAAVWRSPLARRASDHLPVTATVAV